MSKYPKRSLKKLTNEPSIKRTSIKRTFEISRKNLELENLKKRKMADESLRVWLNNYYDDFIKLPKL